jgi:hypothetical protein
MATIASRNHANQDKHGNNGNKGNTVTLDDYEKHFRMSLWKIMGNHVVAGDHRPTSRLWALVMLALPILGN